jgi:spermidine synthase
MRPRTWTAGLLLFGSGFCALVYQIGWLREFRLIFGASTAASAAVLAIFIGGLGIGSLVFGPRADRHPRPLLFYSNLEATIAVCAALSPLLLALVRIAYLATGGSVRLGMPIATAGRLALSAIVLAIPTLAMGGTLPAVARAVTRAGDTRRQDVAVLYALNTLGAVAGCVVATFWMLEIFGTRKTLWLAAAVNLLVAVIARQIDREWAGKAAAAPASPAGPAPPAPDLPELPVFVLVASATVGFAFFLLELIWYRLLGPLLGGSVFTFGLVLAVALAGIGIGGLLYALISSDRPATLSGFAASCLLEAVGVAGTYALGDRIAVLALALLPLRSVGFASQIAGWTIVTTIVVLPAALIAGYQFPLLIALLGRGRERVGRHIGLAYAANTGGAIVGSLAGGFGLIPWLAAPRAWQLVAIVLLVLGIAALVLSGAGRRAAPRAIPHLAFAALTVVLLFAPGPTAFWRHTGIGAGRTPPDVLSSPNDLRAWMSTVRRRVIWEADGVESSVALAEEPSGFAFIVNGKSDGSARGDAGTQVMLGLIGALRNPRAERSLVIGLGTGSTAGWLAAMPSMQRVDVVELEPVVLDVARACAPVNHDAMRSPKLHITIGDARELLLTGRDRYDIIASEPSNPFRAGIASLFTQEYYRAARGRLTDNGVFAQWVQAYEIDTPTLRTIYATLASVFPYIETWQTTRGDLVLLAAPRRSTYSVSSLAAQVGREPLRSAIANAWRAVDVNGLLAHFIANDRFASAFAGSSSAEINTDDRNIVEFGLARSLGRVGALLVAEIRRAARESGTWQPPLDDPQAVRWPVVDTAWANFNGWDASSLAALGAADADEQARRSALQRFYNNGDRAGARESWRGHTDPPRDPSELAMAADLDADAGSDTALPLIEQLRAYQPAEADTELAVLRLRQSRVADAAAALESALVRLRTDPWPLLAIKQNMLTLADLIVSREPALTPRVYAALSQPFSAGAVDDTRLVTAADVAARGDFAAMCRGPIGRLEPHVMWTERFLYLRRECYRSTNDPRLAAATRDLQEFLSHESQPIGKF